MAKVTTKKETVYTIIARRKEYVLGEPRVRGEVIKVSKKDLKSLEGTKYQAQIDAQLETKTQK